MQLDFAEEAPLNGERIVKARVLLKDVEPFSVMFLALRVNNPDLAFRKWNKNPDYSSTIMCTQVDRNGHKEIVAGIVGGKNITGYTLDLGSIELDVNTTNPLELGDDDITLVIADLLATGGVQMAISASNLVKTVSPPEYQNALAQNYPNPFNPSTTVAYSIREASYVKLSIYNVRGARVRNLVDEKQTPNNYRVLWDGRDNSGNSVASGVYFYRLEAGDFTATRKMVLLR